MRERGEEHERRSTLDLDELLYWIFGRVTYIEAVDYERKNRIDSEDFRRLLFQRQLELLGRLNPRWLDRYRGERAELLREVGVY